MKSFGETFSLKKTFEGTSVPSVPEQKTFQNPRLKTPL